MEFGAGFWTEFPVVWGVKLAVMDQMTADMFGVKTSIFVWEVIILTHAHTMMVDCIGMIWKRVGELRVQETFAASKDGSISM